MNTYDIGTPEDRAVPSVDQRVKFELTSRVIHSFWVLTFLFKMDVVPSPDKFGVTPNKEGTSVKCAELSGVDHSHLFTVKVVPQAEFDQHMHQNCGPRGRSAS